MDKGKVWLVGAGPGDDGLLTIKGQKVLESAEAVVYDALVGSGILARIPSGAECVYVGKRRGNHTMPQEEINQCLVSLAGQGKRVVRLKGGDPFLFGRGGEEIEALVAGGIPFEVVPGVSSALAVPAYCGIPVTHRDYCSSVHIITGHKRKGKPLVLDFDALCRLKGTLVFLMGVTALADICRGLLQAGMDENMPAAILSRGTTACQKSLVATVKTLPEQVNQQGVVTPAVIVVGQVCGLWREMEWYGKLPLSGIRVAVTRPKERSKELSDSLRLLGAEVLEIPSIEIVPIQDNVRLWQALEEIEQYQWLVFTSPSGVDIFFEECSKKRVDIRRLSGLCMAVIGAGTGERLEQHGIFADLMPEVYSGRQLGQCLAAQVKEGDRILIPRARMGNQEMILELEKIPNVSITDVPIYDTLYTDTICPQIRKELMEMGDCIVVFTSASTVRGFMAGIGKMPDNVEMSVKTKGDVTKESIPCRQLMGIKAACIGEQTGQEAKTWGMEAYVAKEATVESLVELVLQMVQELQIN